MKIERDRLIENIEKMKERNLDKYSSPEDFEKAQKGYMRSANLRTSEQLRKVVDFLGGNHRAKTGETIINYILKKIGPKLFEL